MTDDDYRVDYIRGKITPEEFLRRDLCEQSFRRYDALMPDGGRIIYSTIVEAFWEMDRLDRGDPFWRKSNMRALVSRVSEFAAAMIERGIDLPTNHWRLLAVDIMYCENLAGAESWRPVMGFPWFTIDLIVRYAWHVWAQTGWQSAEALAIVLCELDRVDAGMKALMRLSEDVPGSRGWAEDIQQQLRG